MLDWLGETHDHAMCKEAARLLEGAVKQGYASGRIHPAEFGGSGGTESIAATVKSLI
jgi:hypothetical protein